MDILGYQFQGTMVEFMVMGALIGAGFQVLASMARGEVPGPELFMPAAAGAIISMMIFFFYSGTR